MAITYAAGAGTHITSHALNETGTSQTQQTGNNTVVVSDALSVVGNGQIGDGTTGLGDTYVGRLIIINRGLSSEQRRKCESQAAGTGTTLILTMHEDWNVNPVSTDIVEAAYELADIEDGSASGGIGFGARTGLFTTTNDLTIDADGGLQIIDGVALELDDNGVNVVFFNASGGYFYTGYEANGSYINGCIITTINGVTGEPGIQMQSGSKGYLYDSLFWSQLVDMQWEHAAGAGLEAYGCKWLNNNNELHLYDMKVIDCKAYGEGAATAIIRMNTGSNVNGLIISGASRLDSVADTTAETITTNNVTFVGLMKLTTRDNKIWNVVNPVWSVVTSTDIDDTNVTGTAAVYDKRSVDAVVQEADGTKLQNAVVNIYENTLADLVQKLTTDVNGIASGSFNYLEHVWTTGTGATTARSGHALQAGKWLYLPFVSAQPSDEFFNGAIVLSTDPNIVQTTQATALTDGSGITWTEDANTSSLIAFTGGSGGTIGLAVGDTITGAGGATGVVTAIMSGDTTAGEIHLKTRNTTAFVSSETIDNGADGWTATYTASTQQDFAIWIDGNAKAYQTIYDYIAALTTETALSATGELIWEWCRSAQTQALYATGSSFYTETSNSKGIIIVNGGAGTLDYFTDDAGTQWTPPTSITLKMVVKDSGGTVVVGANAYIDDDNATPFIMNTTTNGSGEASVAHTDGPIAGTTWRVRKYGYRPYVASVDISTSDITLPITLITDPQQV